MKFEKQLTIFQNKNLQNFCRLLRVDKERPQTPIQIAFNSDNLSFAVSETRIQDLIVLIFFSQQKRSEENLCDPDLLLKKSQQSTK